MRKAITIANRKLSRLRSIAKRLPSRSTSAGSWTSDRHPAHDHGSDGDKTCAARQQLSAENVPGERIACGDASHACA